MATKKAVKAESEEKMIKITLIKSTIGCLKNQKDTIAALGLKKISQSKIMKDCVTVRGMLDIVNHLVKVENV